MAKRGGLAGQVLVLGLVAAGCGSNRELDWSGSAFLLATGKDRVVAGSLESVAFTTQETLRRLELDTTLSRAGDTIRLTSATKNGQNFSLVLTSERTDHGELTHIRFEWEKGRNDEMEWQILSRVEVPAKP
jgi:hypothetical protein